MRTNDMKIIQYIVDEWHNRIAITDDGKVYKSKNRGVAGENYNPWKEWLLADEIKRDINANTNN